MTGKASRRNYAAMKDEKLRVCEAQLTNGGDAFKRAVNGGGDPAADLAVVRSLLDQRGLPSGDTPALAVPEDDEPLSSDDGQFVGAHLGKATDIDELLTVNMALLAGNENGLLAEPKLDGFWLQLWVGDAFGVKAWTRQGAEVTERIPHIISWASKNLPVGARLVGELVHGEQQGSNLVHQLMRRTSKDPTGEGTAPLNMVVFDCLAHSGADISGERFASRRVFLRSLLDPWIDTPSPIQPIFQEPLAEGVYERYVSQGFEGIMVKDPAAPYQPGKRGAGMWKCKAEATVDVVVMGVTEGNGEFAGMAGSLTIGQHSGDGLLLSNLTERGHVSSGLDFLERRAIWKDPDAYQGRVLELRHMGIQAGGFRHPTFIRWRDDLVASDIEIHDGR